MGTNKVERILVTTKQLTDWIYDRPDTLAVNMMSAKDQCDDGPMCVMFDYGVAHGFEFNSCSMQSWWKRSDKLEQDTCVAELDVMIGQILPSELWGQVRTYRDAKSILAHTAIVNNKLKAWRQASGDVMKLISTGNGSVIDVRLSTEYNRLNGICRVYDANNR